MRKRSKSVLKGHIKYMLLRKKLFLAFFPKQKKPDTFALRLKYPAS